MQTPGHCQECCWLHRTLLAWSVATEGTSRAPSRCANIRQRRYDSVNTATSRAKLLRLCLFTKKKNHEWLRPSGAAEISRAGSGGREFSSVIGFEMVRTNLSGSGCFLKSRAHPDISSIKKPCSQKLLNMAFCLCS